MGRYQPLPRLQARVRNAVCILHRKYLKRRVVPTVPEPARAAVYTGKCCFGGLDGCCWVSVRVVLVAA